MLHTTIAGSLPQPEWLIDRERLRGLSPPRIRMRELWRVEERFLEGAQDDATLLAINLQERVGLDIVTDGEMRRESYANAFTTTLEGLDVDRPGTAPSRTGRANPVPRVVGPVRRRHPVASRDVEFMHRHAQRPMKIAVPGPFTMAHMVQNEYYAETRSLALAFADAVNEEIRDLEAAGADIVQIDEPLLQAWPDEARAYGIEAINRTLVGVSVTTALHTCFGYGHLPADRPPAYPFLAELNGCAFQQLAIEAAHLKLDLSTLAEMPDKVIMLGVIDVVDAAVETADQVADRIRAALRFVPPERLMPATDCGMKYLPHAVTYRKLLALVEGTRLVRRELFSFDGETRIP
ncbi:MAG: 5-methyltetrahydropteroyltriglutamate--homocysteine methyltransferase [Chloroflexi bacterium]|nr:5-methyltetrahydropteroyltriglutamate--homocysteine methyltransferase [Chloroflexota bacterium]